MKTLVLESLLNKIASLKPCNVIKKTPRQVFSCKICKIFKNIFFYKTGPVAASASSNVKGVRS